MEIVTSWEQEGAQKALERVALNLLRECIGEYVIKNCPAIPLERNRKLLDER